MQTFCKFKAAAEFAVCSFSAVVLAWDKYFMSWPGEEKARKQILIFSILINFSCNCAKTSEALENLTNPLYQRYE
jgi:hypothetical protein